MKTLILGTVLLVAQVGGKPSEVDQLAWLAGTWEVEQGGRTVTEVWMKPAGGAMLGMSRTVASGAMREHEFLTIQVVEGVLTYTAQPSGQAKTHFALKSSAGKEVVFENLNHDFPQRIGYKLEGDALTAFIEGKRANGELRRIEFPYKRVKP